MAPRFASASPFCRPEEDPFLLLESCGKAIEGILRGHAGRPLRRSWIDRPYGEEEIARLEEEVLPAIQPCLARVEEIDGALTAETDRKTSGTGLATPSSVRTPIATASAMGCKYKDCCAPWH